jgi:hypothetical protein
MIATSGVSYAEFLVASLPAWQEQREPGHSRSVDPTVSYLDPTENGQMNLAIPSHISGQADHGEI